MVDSERVDRADTVTLLDGAVVSLRRLDEDDAEAMIAFHRDPTDRERCYRFFVIHLGFLHTSAQAGREESNQLCDRRFRGGPPDRCRELCTCERPPEGDDNRADQPVVVG